MHRTRECLDEIVSLYQAGSHEKAPELLQRITDLFFLTLDQQSAVEMDSFGDVMIRMSKSADTVARARFAERMSKAHKAPTELLLLLADDEICVARPVLQYSKCLREGDLVSAASKQSQDHLSALAHRHHLTQPVTDILVARGNKDVLTVLAQNVGATLSPSGKRRLFERAADDRVLLDALNGRRDTASSPIHKLKRLGESEFWQRVAETLLMSEDEEIIDKPEPPVEVTETEPEETESQQAPEISPANQAAMRGNAATNEKLLVESARAGKIVETIDVLANISGLDNAMVEHCVFQAHLPALMVLCRAHKLAASTFTSILQLRENYTETPITNTIDLLRRYEAMTPDTAKRVIRFADKAKPESTP